MDVYNKPITISTQIVFVLLSAVQLFSQSYSGEEVRARAEELKASNQVRRIELAKQANDPVMAAAFQLLFMEAKTPSKKKSWAQLMVLSASTNGVYRKYLIEGATNAIDSGAPCIYRIDSSGEVVRGQPSTEFKEWCRRNSKDVGEESRQQLMEGPSDVSILAEIADRSSMLLFERGLKSNNPLIVISSAYGLGVIGDPGSIPLLISCAIRSPVNIDAGICRALARFNGSRREIREQLKGTKLAVGYEESVKREEQSTAIKIQDMK